MSQQRTISPAGRISELSGINKDVATLLESAGQAVHALTNRPLNLHDSLDEDTQMSDSTSDSVDARKDHFRENATSFFENLQAITARLRRQAYALEEAGIITPDPLNVPEQPKAAPPPAQGRGMAVVPKEQQLDPERIKNGGLGNLDVGWLNSRGNKVGAEKEAELVQETKDLLEGVLRDGGSIG
ncbi:Putative mediator complex, subunit Med11 [Septoria linicola]|uniref:Mediator of RNA polymerase II transcription subunit 11 n=1 Tax=Septoria linicola TaxID=215465 RepID=A0A9Q9B8B6_9PEZI|nr:putative mediator complex, subunit Med11 [Septoria linicola]USW59248.1 Putative mediator complex, subunit Med11 [Septoria linicola]